MEVQVPSSENNGQSVRRSFGDDAIAYYRQHYKGLTRGKLAQQDPSLYQRLRRDRLLDQVPKKGDR